MGIRCFMLHETNRWQLSMRRYARTDEVCPGPYGYHDAQTQSLEVVECTPDADGCFRGLSQYDDRWPHEDPRWPKKCDHCAREFLETDPWQVFHEHVFVDDAGKEFFLRSAPPGAMWFADWMGEWSKGPDGHCLLVKCPDRRDWMIDGPANNCTMKDDRGPFESHHRCWCRHGTPPVITVDKNGRTCGAGGGSIQTPGYHGFLRNGVFEP